MVQTEETYTQGAGRDKKAYKVYPAFGLVVQVATMTRPPDSLFANMTSLLIMNSHVPDELTGSITAILYRLEEGSDGAVEELFKIYFSRLANLGKVLLPTNRDRKIMDEEDLAIQVIQAFFSDVRDGKLPPLKSRADVWRMLSSRLRQRAINHQRDLNRAKRGGGKVSGESIFRNIDGGFDPNGINQVTDPLQALADLHQSLLESISDDLLRTIAQMVMDGMPVDTVAETLGKSRATIYRKLDLIKKAWLANL